MKLARGTLCNLYYPIYHRSVRCAVIRLPAYASGERPSAIMTTLIADGKVPDFAAAAEAASRREQLYPRRLR
jgi:hypothetical protein